MSLTNKIKVGDVWAHVLKADGEAFRVFLVLETQPPKALCLYMRNEPEFSGSVMSDCAEVFRHIPRAAYTIEKM